MATKTKVMLGLAAVFLIIGGLIWWGPLEGKLHPSFNVLFPLGVIMSGLCLISNMFAKEDQVYGEDQKRAVAKMGEQVKVPPANRM